MWSVVLETALLLGSLLPAPIPPATPDGPSVLVIEDFDHPRLHRSRLEADWGVSDESQMRIEFTPEVRYGASGYGLRVHYASPPGRPGGLWFSTAGRAQDLRHTLDLSRFDELRFRTRGWASDSRKYRLRVELEEVRAPAGPACVAYRTEVINGGLEWECHRLPLDPHLWSGTSAGSPDAFTHVKTLRILLSTPENPPDGDFYLDTIECARTQLVPFDWKAASDDDLINYIEYHTYGYFQRYSDPETGYAFDRSCCPEVSSVSACGFALSGHAIAASRGWISPQEGANRVRRILRALAASDQRASRRGMYFHFVNAESSIPERDSEISIIDTALLVSGIYVARNYFTMDEEISKLSDRLIREVDWGWFYDAPRGLFYMAWSPVRRLGYEYPDPRGDGYFCGGEHSPVHWGVYTDEVGLISILAAASPTHAVPTAAFHSIDMTRRDYKGIRMTNSYNGSLFTYFFGSCYLDTRSFGSTSGDFNWYVNSARAITANHEFAVEQRMPAWAFGISACEGPDGRYHNYGAPPSTVAPEFDGTLAVYGIVGSLLHQRDATLLAIRELFALNLFQENGGFADAFNPLKIDPRANLPWVNWTGFGIDQGAILMILENARTGFAWKQFESDRVIGRTLSTLFPERKTR